MLIALLALPATAQGPVSVTWTQPSYGLTAPPTFTPLGADRCLLKLSWTIEHAGDQQGNLVAETWSFMNAPCFDKDGNPPAPNSVPETWVSTGTFTGTVKGKYGTADFIEYRQMWPAAAGEVYWQATGVHSLNAVGELANMSLVSDYQVRQGDVPVLGGWVDFTPGAFRDLKMSLYGTYNGIPFFKYTGTFYGAGAGGPYSAPFELVLPGHPALGNERLVFEPIHPTGGVLWTAASHS